MLAYSGLSLYVCTIIVGALHALSKAGLVRGAPGM